MGRVVRNGCTLGPNAAGASPPIQMMVRFLTFLVALLVPCIDVRSGASPSFVTFESGHVRPLALSPDGRRLFALNTPAGRLEIFDVTVGGLSPAGEVTVGLEPVAVAARTNSEVWVVNHLSDSVSIVQTVPPPARVVRTLLLCDEPRDIVFGGPGRNRAFITTARRGQNCPVPASIETPGIGRALVMVFDGTNVGDGLGGSPLTVLELFGDTPRALAVSEDANTVYAAIFHSGNQTATVHELIVCDGGEATGPCMAGDAEIPGGLPAPNKNIEGIPGTEVGLIVRYDLQTGVWGDELGRDWTNAIRFNLPDKDVFAIDAAADPPVQTGEFAGVGTVLFNMVVNPVTGTVYVSNTEARNEVRFSGSGTLNTTTRGHLHEARITVLAGSSVNPRHLNKHIDYETVPVQAGTKEKSLATPLSMEVSGDGETLYVAAFGSSKIGVFGTAALEADSFVPDAADHIAVPGGGPSGMVLDEPRGQLYVLTRFDNSIVVIRTSTRAVVQQLTMFNPEPRSVVQGRPFFYDAMLSSDNGEASCASCHVFGDFDSLAWDLGEPEGLVIENPNPFTGGGPPNPFHPMKGPMTTQSMRGLANHGPLHWRGDKTGALNTPPSDGLDVRAAFRAFNGAFGGLLGRDEGPIDDADMSTFADFAVEITYPPNPIRSLDNSLTASEQRGLFLYNNLSNISDIPLHSTCQGCHPISLPDGYIGADGLTVPGLLSWFKTPHFRNLYQKVGMFGMAAAPLADSGEFLFGEEEQQHMGDQVRGFGFDHGGATDTLFRFNHYFLFVFQGEDEVAKDAQRRDLENFLLAFESNLAPIVGQQATLAAGTGTSVESRIDLLIERSGAARPVMGDLTATECDLIVKGTLDGEARGWYRTTAGAFRSDRVGESPATDAELRTQAETLGQEMTYTCAPPGSGMRMGVDRDEDSFFDRDELDAGLDPDTPNRISGRGRRMTDCLGGWFVQNPGNDPFLDRRGQPSFKQSCVDGDPLCDLDGSADGKCTFQVAACFSLSGDVAPAATPCEVTAVHEWEVRRPTPDDRDAVDAANAVALRDAVVALSAGLVSGAREQRVTFSTPMTGQDVCAEPVEITVPLRGRNYDRKRTTTLRTFTLGTVTGRAKAARDLSKLKLSCLPNG